MIINKFIFLNFNYYPLVWGFHSKTATKKIEKFKKDVQIDFLGIYN